MWQRVGHSDGLLTGSALTGSGVDRWPGRALTVDRVGVNARVGSLTGSGQFPGRVVDRVGSIFGSGR